MYVAFCSVMMPVPNKLCLTAMPVMSVAHMRSCLELMAAMVFCPSLMCSRFEKTLTYGNSIDKMDAKGSRYKAAADNRPVDEHQFIPSIAGIFLAKRAILIDFCQWPQSRRYTHRIAFSFCHSGFEAVCCLDVFFCCQGNVSALKFYWRYSAGNVDKPAESRYQIMEVSHGTKNRFETGHS